MFHVDMLTEKLDFIIYFKTMFANTNLDTTRQDFGELVTPALDTSCMDARAKDALIGFQVARAQGKTTVDAIRSVIGNPSTEEK